MALRPWSPVPIHDCGEPLQPLPAQLLRLEPHPYVAVGAPYGSACPFRLRSGVIVRLLEAQRWLQGQRPHLRLAVFDAWRPLAVQRHMVLHTIHCECARLGLDPNQATPELAAIQAEVGRFWAPPSDDPATPPPHSTGAAVDLTLANADGEPLPMGSAIDALGAVSEPDHFWHQAQAAATVEQRQQALLWHDHRQLLREAMAHAGFAQHPNEWWHFSHGDQLWAWRRGQPSACYGRCPEPIN